MNVAGQTKRIRNHFNYPFPKIIYVRTINSTFYSPSTGKIFARRQRGDGDVRNQAERAATADGDGVTTQHYFSDLSNGGFFQRNPSNIPKKAKL